MENSKNNNENKSSKRQLILKKNYDFEDLLKVKEFFEDPNKYLRKDKNMIVGTISLMKNSLSKTNIKGKSKTLCDSLQNNSENKEAKKTKVVKSGSNSYTQGHKLNKKKFVLSHPKISLMIKKNKNFLNSNLKSNFKTYLNNLKQFENIKDNGIHYQRKSFNEIISILEKSKEREEQTKAKGTNDLLPKKAKDNIKLSFYEQENILKRNLKLKDKKNLLSRLLSSKLKRKEDDLLINKIEEYRLRRQLIDYIENSKSFREKYGNNFWLADLRRSNNQGEIRFNYFSNGNKNNDPDKIIDCVDREIEFINDPNSLKKNKYATLLKNLSLNNIFLSNIGLKIDEMENINKIEVIKGRNLVDQEYLRIMEGNKNLSTGNRMFRLYKDPLEKKYKNIVDFVCGENYKNNFKDKKNLSFCISQRKKIKDNSYIYKKNKKKKKKKGLFKSLSQVEDNKKKKRYLNEALEIYKKENMKKTIKIISQNFI